MTIVQFDKMHGLGNDFVVIDARVATVALTADVVRALGDRHTGIGFDQLIIVGKSTIADLSMRIFNADGSEVEACGNATRCVVAREGRDVTIETKAGLLHGQLTGTNVSVDMGKPRFAWQDIPLAYAMDAQNLPLGWDEVSGGFCVNIGNPHVVFFLSDETQPDFAQIGSIIETDAIFPDRVNVNFARVRDGAIDLVVWERGAGLTRACGTGACATAVAAIQEKRVSSPVTVNLLGGTLDIAWETGGSITMSGAASHVYSGSFDTDNFA